jgi:ketosteroid isomerase-like protein
MIKHDNIVIVKKIQEAFVKSDFEEMKKYLAENVIWNVTGSEDYPLAGRYCGFEELEELFKKFGDIVKDIEYEAESFEYIIATGDRVFVLGQEKINWFGGGTFETKFIQMFSLRNAKVIEFREARG